MTIYWLQIQTQTPTICANLVQIQYFMLNSSFSVYHGEVYSVYIFNDNNIALQS